MGTSASSSGSTPQRPPPNTASSRQPPCPFPHLLPIDGADPARILSHFYRATGGAKYWAPERWNLARPLSAPAPSPSRWGLLRRASSLLSNDGECDGDGDGDGESEGEGEGFVDSAGRAVNAPRGYPGVLCVAVEAGGPGEDGCSGGTTASTPTTTTTTTTTTTPTTTHVVSVRLRNNGLRGRIPQTLSFSSLPHLVRLDLAGNRRLEGFIPADIGQCTALRELNLRCGNYITMRKAWKVL